MPDSPGIPRRPSERQPQARSSPSLDASQRASNRGNGRLTLPPALTVSALTPVRGTNAHRGDAAPSPPRSSAAEPRGGAALFLPTDPPISSATKSRSLRSLVPHASSHGQAVTLRRRLSGQCRAPKRHSHSLLIGGVGGRPHGLVLPLRDLEKECSASASRARILSFFLRFKPEI